MNVDSTILENAAAGTSASLLSKRVRSLASNLREKTRGSAFEAETSALAEEVFKLCDFVSEVHEELGNVIAEAEADAPSPNAPRKTIYESEAETIQRSNHKVSETALDVVKALFMWREPPGGLKKSR